MAWGLHASEFVPSACGWAERAQLHTQAAVLGHAQGWDMHVACAAAAAAWATAEWAVSLLPAPEPKQQRSSLQPSLPPSWFPSTLLCSAERHLCLCSWILTSEPFQQPDDCPSTLSLRWITPSICVCKGFRKIYQARRPPSVHCHYRALCCKAAQPNPTQRGAMLNPLERPPICVGVGDHLCFQGRAPGPCFTHVLTGQCQALAVAV